MNLFKRDNVVQLSTRSRIEALIDEIDQFGYLMLYRSDLTGGTWVAVVERKHRGAEVKCRSNGDNKTPVDALESLAKVIRGLK